MFFVHFYCDLKQYNQLTQISYLYMVEKACPQPLMLAPLHLHPHLSITNIHKAPPSDNNYRWNENPGQSFLGVFG